MTAINTDTATSPRRRFIATAVSLALGGAGYASSVLFTGGVDLGTAAQTPLVVVSNWITAIAAIALAVQLPAQSLTAAVPGWITAITAAGLGFLGAFAFAMATVVPHFGLVLRDPGAFVAESLWMDALGYPKQLLLLVGFFGFAIIGRVRHLLGWPRVIGLAFAGLVNAVLWPYAPGAIVAGLVLATLSFGDPHSRTVPRN